METIGFIGVGKIGLPICENLIKSGYRVVGFRRGSLADFEKIGGTPGKSPADVREQAGFVFSRVPTSQAVHEVAQGPNGLIQTAPPAHNITHLRSHSETHKTNHV